MQRGRHPIGQHRNGTGTTAGTRHRCCRPSRHRRDRRVGPVALDLAGGERVRENHGGTTNDVLARGAGRVALADC